MMRRRGSGIHQDKEMPAEAGRKNPAAAPAANGMANAAKSPAPSISSFLFLLK
jgi:hypothetical protein